ncbi:MAG: aldose 1-epimerase family protein [Hydrogenoanaerobacterium sp.]
MTINLKLGERNATVDTMGAELVSYRDEKNTEYIWGGDPAYWNGRNPLLFPIIGRLNNEKIDINGTAYEMGQHGFAKHSEFELVKKDDSSATLRLCENKATLAQYPFRFELLVHQVLIENGFNTSFTVRNTDDKPIMFCIGAHTAFRVPMIKNERFEDYSLVFPEIEDLESNALTSDGRIDPTRKEAGLDNTDYIPLRHELFDINTLIFEGLRSQSVKLCSNTTGHGVNVDFTGFPILSFWSMPHTDAPYICIEPWHGTAAIDGESGNFADKPYVITVPVGEEYNIGYEVTTL